MRSLLRRRVQALHATSLASSRFARNLRPLALILLSSSAAFAQSPFYARSEPVPTGALPFEPLLPPNNTVPGLPGATLSPDGRLLVAAHFPSGGIFPAYSQYGWFMTCLRPEKVTASIRGIAEFPASTISGGPWSMGTSIETHLPAPAAGAHPVPRRQFVKQWLSMCPDPAFRSLPCPFPSNSAAAPGQPGTSAGQFDTYQMLVFGADIWGPVGTSQTSGIDATISNNIDQPIFTPTNGKTVLPIGMRRLCVTVSNPRTENAMPRAPSPVPPAPPLLSPDFDVLLWQHPVLGTMPVLGIEPSISLDGRLLVFHGNVANNTRLWNSAKTDINQIMYTFNPTPGVRTGWSMPKPINDMYVNEQNTIVNGVPFARRYPIAAQPMTMADGAALTQPLAGAYPWMTLDATDLVFSATARGNGATGTAVRDRGMSIVGRSTGYSVRHIDGPLNPDRDTTDRVITTGTGHTPGIWSWGGDTPNLKLPYTRLGTTIPIFHAQQRQYAEICVDEILDREYLLAWDANEFMKEDATSGWILDNLRTPDTSGSRITGALSAEAKFPEDWLLASNSMTGASGQQILCTANGQVSATDPKLNGALSAFSASLWFGGIITNAQPFSLIDKAGSYDLVADAQGRVRARVQTTGGVLQSPFLGTAQTSTWRHAAMTYGSGTRRLRVYIDGAMVHEQFGATPAPVLASTSTLRVGPAGINVSGSGAPAGWVGVDQVRLSRVERTADEIARQAFAAPPPAAWQTLPTTFTLPRGLDRAETKVPVGNVPARLAIDLGDTLFHDTAFSPIHGASCATCHQDPMSFTDGIAQRPGFATGNPLRNAQTVLNRLFSTRQFWDGRADDLESQVLHPLFNPDEIGSNDITITTVLGTASYVASFQATYGAAPSLDLMQKALASYQRALVAGDNAVDRFEAGIPGLTPNEINGRNLFLGKARCFGCHAGSNYSDERFHVTVLSPADNADVVIPFDSGRFGSSGRLRDTRRFKTPTLRNLPQTGPFMHRGQVTALSSVIQLYDQGGVAGAVIDDEILPLDLTAGERADLEAFLLALNAGWIKL